MGDIKLLDNKESVSISTLVENNCKRCYGRGHLGYNKDTGKFVICKCVLKNAKKKYDSIDSVELIINNPYK